MDNGHAGRDGRFPATRLSVIERLRADDGELRREAFGDVVEGYWKPLYKHLRLTWRLDAEEARDVTQAFFADAFQKSWLERYEPGRARFRTFVRVCADRFVMNVRQSAGRLKRGGGAGQLPVDFDAAEREFALQPVHDASDPDSYFHQEFVRDLFDRSLRAVRAECLASGREVHYQLLERYDLAADGAASYADLAAEFGLKATQVTNYLAHVRRRFREHVLVTLRSLCGSEAEYRREARELFGMEVE